MKRFSVVAGYGALALVLVTSAMAGTAARWTPAQAAAKIKATYSTVDQKAYDFTKAKLDHALEQGKTEDDPLVIALRKALTAQMHGAKATKASCKGAGAAVAGRYSRFRCVVTVQGSARIPPDYVLFTATKKLTVRLGPWRVSEGWR